MELGARLRAFSAFVRRRSFIGAADELRISQSAVSQHIADMERDLGVKLIERRSRALTAAGELLASHVLRAQALLAQAANCVTALREPEAGSLSIVASGTPGTYLLPEIIAKFQQLHPGVRISFGLNTAKAAVDAIRSHKAELGVVGAFVAAPEIEAEPLIEDEIVIVGPPSLARKRLSRDRVEELTWVHREEGSGTNALAQAIVGEAGIIPRHRLALPSWEAIKLAVRAGCGIAAVSRLAVIEELDTGSLAVLPILASKARRTFWTIRTRDAALTPTAERFLSMLRERCAVTARADRRKPKPRPKSRRR
jgi:LysR family transcriptional regulator, transcriptional activator of the cysJI operon